MSVVVKELYYSCGKLNMRSIHVDGKLHGEYSAHTLHGEGGVRSIYRNDKLHGEYKRFNLGGRVSVHRFYMDGVDITEEVLAEFPNELTDHDKFLIKLKWGIECLS